MKNKLQQGFTLIELLVVIAIIGILSGFLLTNLQGMRARARDAQRKASLDGVRKAVLLYANNAEQYPIGNNANGNLIIGCGTYAIPTTCDWGEVFAVTIDTKTTTFMSSLPLDPLSTSDTNVEYNYYSDGVSFTLIGELENASDTDGLASQAKCSTAYADYRSDSGASQQDTDYVLCEQ